MLGRGDHSIGGEGSLAEPPLQSLDHGPRIGADQLRVLAVAFVGAAPSVVPGHRDRRAEGPVGPDGPGLFGGGVADAADQVGIAGRAQPDVMGEDRGSRDVVVAMNGVQGEHDRDRNMAGPMFQRDRTEGADHVEPRLRRRPIVAARPGVAPGQDGPERIGAEVVRLDRTDVGLNHLADLLLQAHPLHQSGDEGLGACIRQRRGAVRPWPERRVHLAGSRHERSVDVRGKMRGAELGAAGQEQDRRRARQGKGLRQGCAKSPGHWPKQPLWNVSGSTRLTKPSTAKPQPPQNMTASFSGGGYIRVDDALPPQSLK